ncbi:MAG: endonuclease domain-containing protein [Desulfuromusa sp.]|nr:endonuclease domain-containing protein [Desulfuromusa sp.]
MLGYNNALKESSRNLRNNVTEAERLLWSRLRRKQLQEIQFYRQKPIGNFIVDFYAPAVCLVIEVDGSQHLGMEHRVRDELRDEFLAELGLTVLRFDNRQVLSETDAVVEQIFRWMSCRF